MPQATPPDVLILLNSSKLLYFCMGNYLRKTVDVSADDVAYMDKLIKSGLLVSYSHAVRFFIRYHRARNRNLKYAHFQQWTRDGIDND